MMRIHKLLIISSIIGVFGGWVCMLGEIWGCVCRGVSMDDRWCVCDAHGDVGMNGVGMHDCFGTR